MADWADDVKNHLERKQENDKGLLAIPPWIPGYLFRNMDIPEPPIQRGILDKLEHEGKTALKVAVASGMTLVARPFLKYILEGNEYPESRFWRPSLSATMWHLFSAGTLTQILSSETLLTGLYRASVLTNFSPWLRSALTRQGISAPIATLMAQLPAHLPVMSKLAANMLLLNSPVKLEQQQILFENSELNTLAKVFLQSPLLDGNFEPVIDIIPTLEAGVQATSSRQPDNLAWQHFFSKCSDLGITYLRLYPVVEGGGNRLYMRAWRNNEPGQRILIAQFMAPSPVFWWTDQVMYNDPLVHFTINPLSRQVIRSLPDYLASSTQGTELPRNSPETLQPAKITTTHHGKFTTIMNDKHGMIFLDWNTQSENSNLPLITLLTEDIDQPVTEHQLSAINHTQAQKLTPYEQITARAAHDTFWFFVALQADRITRYGGNKIYNIFSELTYRQ
ncbi:hypothetical protein [Parendozoicomonas sp. Alg238-R29]|uniref:hypothetical protein n=1 Tax=Parendozoicomonas sp. Alg238-R29 TaxID=2993446 RepID=UPI00248E7CAC|nr:hypothetical protein [Parendozoicomonas sp. Alg238-R29]